MSICNLLVIATLILYIVFVSCHKHHMRRNMPSIHVRELLNEKDSRVRIDECKHSVRQVELNWDKIKIFCEYFHEVDGKMVADSYFQTTAGTNFRHCRASAWKVFGNNCFDLPFDENIWSIREFSGANEWYVASGYETNDRRCRFKEAHGVTSFNVHGWYFKQPDCSKEKNIGFVGVPKGIKFFNYLCNGPDYVIAECSNKNKIPKNEINWKNIDMFCYHFRDYYKDSQHAEQVAEMYFKAKGDRGTFQFCHGLSDDFTSNCFPGPWDGWKKWTFEHGTVSLGFLTMNNVHCYSKEGAIGDINGMINWFRSNETNCGAFTRAGFHNFDPKKINS